MEKIRRSSFRNAERLVNKGLDEQSIFSPMQIGNLVDFPAETPESYQGRDPMKRRKFWVFKMEFSQQIPTVSADFSGLLVDYRAKQEIKKILCFCKNFVL